MLTLFTVPKAFHGHTGIIQRNAIQSWTFLHPKCEVILLADDDGTAEAAEELGVRHIADVARNEFGTPLLNSAFQRAEESANYELLCHVNADIILMSDFVEAIQRVQANSSKFLMTARRRDFEITERLDFETGWEDRLRTQVSNSGKLSHPTGIDFWVYPKGLMDNMPPFAVGRIATDCWLLYRARVMKADLIDSTEAIESIHQNHDYAHTGGIVRLGTGVEAQRNRDLVGGKPYFFTVRDRTHVLTSKGLKRSLDGWTIWRGIRTAPVLYPDMPWPLRLAIKGLNNSIDFGRDLLIKARNAAVGRPGAQS